MRYMQGCQHKRSAVWYNKGEASTSLKLSGIGSHPGYNLVIECGCGHKTGKDKLFSCRCRTKHETPIYSEVFVTALTVVHSQLGLLCLCLLSLYKHVAYADNDLFKHPFFSFIPLQSVFLIPVEDFLTFLYVHML